MANFMDYLDWRGDLTLDVVPLGEADNLILSYLSYVNLDEVAPKPGEGAVSLREVSEEFFDIYTKDDLDKDKSFIRLAPYLMQKAAHTARFEDTQMKNFVNTVNDETDIQFAAIELVIDDDTSYISFRGTDDSIVGWKEDFLLSNGVVPAQKRAVEYLNQVAKESDRKLIVGGHSKGGNLAIYAAVGCEEAVQDRIITIYNNDGPGFAKEFLSTPALVKMRPKIKRYIPESSIIGMLLEHTVDPVYIQSSEKGIMQHDGFSWQVMGDSFVYAKELEAGAKSFDDILHSWISKMNTEQRKQFILDAFSVLEAPKVDTITELRDGGLNNIKIMMDKINTLQPETKEIIMDLWKALVDHVGDFIHLPDIHLPDFHLPKLGSD